MAAPDELRAAQDAFEAWTDELRTKIESVPAEASRRIDDQIDSEVAARANDCVQRCVTSFGRVLDVEAVDVTGVFDDAIRAAEQAELDDAFDD